MAAAYRAFFGFAKEPFPVEVDLKDIYETQDLAGVADRFLYAVRLGAMALVTGEVGSGKSTAIRFAAAKLHPAEYRVFHLTASSGSILEFYRLFLAQLGVDAPSSSRAFMTRIIKREIIDLNLAKKLKPLLVIDEASLIRLDVFAELHTIAEFEKETRAALPIILIGQGQLIDKLTYRASMPLASRIVARTHLEGVDRQEMEQYLKHHLQIAGIRQNLFDETAVTAIHQGAGGILRKANHLARGALIAAARQNKMQVSAEHVRLAATEIF